MGVANLDARAPPKGTVEALAMTTHGTGSALVNSVAKLLRYTWDSPDAQIGAISNRFRKGMNPHYIAALYHTKDRDREGDIRERFTESELKKLYGGIINNPRTKLSDDVREQLYYDLHRYQVALAL